MQEYNNILWMLEYVSKKGKRIIHYFNFRLEAIEFIESRNLKNYKLICKDTSYWD